jgi:cell wall-associated NlpC family hydrolase
MPTPLRTRLLACALAAFALCCSKASTASARHEPGRWRAIPRRAIPRPTLGDRAAALAVGEVGVPYRWGGTSPASGFDCSGLVYWAYGRLGVKVPHSSYVLYGMGRRVARARMRAGDLLFFSGLGHVGIYIGRGRMVHAPHTGTRVQVVSLGRTSYGRSLMGIRRIARR